MGLDNHPGLNPVSEDTQIWRYYSTSKFLSLLESESLYLSRIDQFEDPFEGYAPVQNLKRQQENGTSIVGAYESLRRSTLASCWSIGSKDKLEMWKTYVPDGDGVAISTTFSNLKSAIENASNFDYYASKVEYIEYFSELYDSNHFYDYIASKPSQYSFENEMRLLMSGSEHRDSGPVPKGQPFEIDLDELINDVYPSPFSPSWISKSSWKNILEKMEVNAEVKRSKLAMGPEGYLR